MLDHHENRLWADHHKAFGEGVKRLAREIGAAFEVLTRLQYDQPWRRTRQRVRND